nr:hypothetical protein B0A51_08568 [Rachicladosporium sp. CCFEE 5018]
MSVPVSWHTIQSDSASLPRLLLKADLGRTGYTVTLTDLSRVWKQTLDRQATFDYAKKHRTVIDPSEDDEQYDILSTKLQDALRQHDGNSTSISAAKSGDLVLDVSIPMPKPLAALQWTFHLTQCTDTAVADTLVYPLLERAQVLKHQMDRLLSELQANDKVISRITDKLERSAYDLTDVFPVAAGVKLNKERSQREQLSKYVQGLGKFDRGAWTDQLDIAEVASGAVGIGKDLINAEGVDADHVEWWRSLRGSITLGTESKPSDHVTQTVSEIESQGQKVSKAEDDFQRQATPPGLHVTQPAVANNAASDSDDLDRSSQASNPSRRVYRDAVQGDTGMKPATLPNPDDGSETEGEEDVTLPDASPQKVIKTRSSSPVAPVSPTVLPSTGVQSSAVKKLGVLGGRKRMASSVEEATPPSTAEEPSIQGTGPSMRPKSRLGTLGGKAARNETETSPQPTPPSVTSPSPVKAKKLGTIGGASAASHVSPDAHTSTHMEELRTSRATSRAITPVNEVRETSVERANRKRNELKKAIEEKAKVPVKKKRKF